MLKQTGTATRRATATNFFGGTSMNVNALSNAQNTYVANANSSASKASTSLWAQLGKSLNSGDLAGAQAAFAALKQNYQDNHSTSGTGKPSGPLVTDVAQLSQALQAGNLGAAQTAFATLSQEAKNLGIGTTGSSAGNSVSATVSAGTVNIHA
jgi:hypothetical protein